MHTPPSPSVLAGSVLTQVLLQLCSIAYLHYKQSTMLILVANRPLEGPKHLKLISWQYSMPTKQSRRPSSVESEAAPPRQGGQEPRTRAVRHSVGRREAIVSLVSRPYTHLTDDRCVCGVRSLVGRPMLSLSCVPCHDYTSVSKRWTILARDCYDFFENP